MALYFLVVQRLPFLGKMQPFAHFTNMFCLSTVLHNWRSMLSKFSCLLCFRRYFIKACSFFVFIFTSLAINNFFNRFINDFRRVSEQFLEMFFPILVSFFLAGYFVLGMLYLPLTSFTVCYANFDYWILLFHYFGLECIQIVLLGMCLLVLDGIS